MKRNLLEDISIISSLKGFFENCKYMIWIFKKVIKDLFFSFSLQRRNTDSDQDDLNDIQIRLPTINRSSRSNLNAVSGGGGGGGGATTPNSKSNNLTVTTAIVTPPTPSTTPETESLLAQTDQSPPPYPQTSSTQTPYTSQNPGDVVKISSLW